MCITYYLKNHINYEESVRELNEKLATARKALSDAEEKSIQVRENATQASDLTNAVMEKLRSGVLLLITI
jgi:phosphomevalonate kinase